MAASTTTAKKVTSDVCGVPVRGTRYRRWTTKQQVVTDIPDPLEFSEERRRSYGMEEPSHPATAAAQMGGNNCRVWLTHLKTCYVVLRGDLLREKARGKSVGPQQEVGRDEVSKAIQAFRGRVLMNNPRWDISVVAMPGCDGADSTPMLKKILGEWLCDVKPMAKQLNQAGSVSAVLADLQAFFPEAGKVDLILLVRFDSYLKRDIDLDDWQQSTVVAPFWQARSKKSSEVCDVLLAWPGSLLGQMVEATAALAASPDMFSCNSLHKLGKVGVPLAVMVDTVRDSNTSKQWNPLYRLLGRPEAAKPSWESRDNWVFSRQQQRVEVRQDEVVNPEGQPAKFPRPCPSSRHPPRGTVGVQLRGGGDDFPEELRMPGHSCLLVG